MAGTPYLVDSNILLRWIKPDDRDYALVVSAIDAVLQEGAVLCYTSQNVAEFWNTCTRPLERNGYGLSPQRPTAGRNFSRTSYICFPIAWLFTRNGAGCWSRTMSPACKFTMRDWLPQCGYRASRGS